MSKNILLWLVIGVILMSVFSNFTPSGKSASEIEYSQFLRQVERGQVSSVTLEGRVISGFTQEGRRFTTYSPESSNTSMIGDLLRNNVEIVGKPPQQQSLLLQLFISSFPILLILAIWIYFMRQMQGGGKGGAMSFGKSKAKLLGEDQIKITFKDVAGCEEAKEDVTELVEFLKDPEKFTKLGGKLPRGVLMVGSPGTGKTLLAKSIAGEAKVPFFTISGSDFVEMFVGVGASRVRDMFEQAKKHSPCIIFIDEIDAVGRHRGAGLGGGHDEREQTLNQLLVEMDGFEGNEGVIIIAATNRPDVLDPALLRPGRFDRQVVVPLPDIKGREQILKVHLRKVPMADNVKPSLIARGTPGFSGADLANLVNEAALFAAKFNERLVGMSHLERAKDKIMMGSERKSMVMKEKERKLTAYHEAGHAIVGLMVPSHDPVYKVSIIPRGRALGVTMFLPEEDRYSLTKEQLNSQISSLYGGRLAEELVFGADMVTTGASNDIERATELARNMVTKWGMSDKLGALVYSEEEGEVFLGRSVTQHKNVSDETTHTIDEEVRLIIDINYERAKDILIKNNDKFVVMAEALLKFETIDRDQIDDIMAGREPREPKGWADLEPAFEGDDDDKDGKSVVDEKSEKPEDENSDKDSKDDKLSDTAEQH
ncbi:MAG: ATP-dependent zinc metalloprotease FtsH [Gammaproteobacteria bacterium]|nr:ATP-dependent zinc metalloprotease FtsH [Gammaproteobacteria bacterium]